MKIKMKKIIALLCLTIFVLFVGVNPILAREITKNFYAYEIKNVNIREASVIIKNAVAAYDHIEKGVPLKDVENAYIYTGTNYTYFIKLYPANQNTHIFVVSNEKYDINDNDVTQYLKKGNYQYTKLDDKAAFNEYQYDFYTLARKEKLGNFYISPDLIKPLKTGMTKLNDYMAKKSKKTSSIPYSIDNDPIKLTCIDTTGYYDSNAKIAIVKKEYRLKEKPTRFMHAFEYVVTNKNDSTATVTVTSERLAGLKDVTTESAVNMDRLDMMDVVGTFPPLLIGTAGLSLVCSLPNWARWVRIEKEAARYAHSLPENYQLRSQGYMRILVLKYKANPKPLIFDVKFPNQKYNIKF